MLLDKTDNDDKLIDAIRAELNKVREKEATAKQELEQVIHVFSCVAVCVQLVSGLCRHSCGHRMMHSQAHQSFKVRMSTAWVEEAATKKGVALGGEYLVVSVWLVVADLRLLSKSGCKSSTSYRSTWPR